MVTVDMETSAEKSAWGESVRRAETYALACKLAGTGLSLVPIRTDGSKAPAVKWVPYQSRRAGERELRAWFGQGYGIGILGGWISGHLELLDFDIPGLYAEWTALCAEYGLGETIARLPLVETPSGGHHLYYRCDQPVGGNTGLAWKRLAIPQEAERTVRGNRVFVSWGGKQYPVVTREGREWAVTIGIETRGEGGYVIAPGSPSACHPDRKPYVLARGSLTAIPTITAAEREALHRLAAVLNEFVDQGKIRGPVWEQEARGGLLPGEDYNARGDVAAELLAAGYQEVGRRGEAVLLKRPGKTEPGLSATFGYGGSRVFYSFSTNDPTFEARTPYSPFAVYTLLRHNGDYSAAAKALSEDGYGDPLPAPSFPALPSPPQRGRNATGSGLECPPEPLDQAAYQGVVGELVRTIAPHTESDPNAILVQMLVGFGNIIGRNAFVEVESTPHFLNLYAVMVGNSAKGRKGTGTGHVLNALEAVCPDYRKYRVLGGLSSGEGLIHAVRDALEVQEPIREKGQIVGYEMVVKDAGEADKRLLVFEPEFARALKVMERDGNTLSSLIRQCWDDGNLRVMTRTPQNASGAHISVIGHITRDELRRYLTDTEAGNGFANRFLWIYQQRSQLLPDGGALRQEDLLPLYERLREAVAFGSRVQCLTRDEEARDAWHTVYPELEREVPGLLGSITARGSAQVLRLSCLYALLDCSPTIRLAHLKAALAVWEYAEQSARFIFGDAVGDSVADTILCALRNSPHGQTRKDISDLLGRNQKADRITTALDTLLASGLAQCRKVETDGRFAEAWYAC